jgi:hypothetical protein
MKRRTAWSRAPWSRAFSIKAGALRQHVVFVGFYGILFELVAGAQPTLYVQLYVLEDTERQRIWQGRTLRFSDDFPTHQTASSIARAGHQVGDYLVYELGTKSTRT